MINQEDLKFLVNLGKELKAQDNLELEEINEELEEFIDDLCDDVDNNKKIEDVIDEVNAFIENIGNQEEIDEE